jgi:WD40 repeat protein
VRRRGGGGGGCARRVERRGCHARIHPGPPSPLLPSPLCSSDRRITYWDAATCEALRVMDGSTEEITCLDIDGTGAFFAAGGLDRALKLFNYDEGTVIATGVGHAGPIRKVRVAPDGATVATVGDDGAIFLWRVPAAARAAAAAAAEQAAGAR